MSELDDRPRVWRGAGYDADVWVRGRKVDAQSVERRAAIAEASRLVFRPVGVCCDREGCGGVCDPYATAAR